MLNASVPFLATMVPVEPMDETRCELLLAEWWRRRKEDYMDPQSELSLLHLQIMDGQMWYLRKTIHICYVVPLLT